MAEHKEHKTHNFFTKPVILAIVIGVVVIIGIVIAIMTLSSGNSKPSCGDVQGTCRDSCYTDETTFNNAKCDSYKSCCIATNTNTNTNTNPDVETTKPEEPQVVETNSCYDSDGNNGDVSGFVQLSSGLKHEDSCLNAKTVIEATCAIDGTAKFTNLPCTYGCRLGACSAEKINCYDSDGGENSFVKGQVVDIFDTTQWDYCKNSQIVIEMYCDSTAGYVDQLAKKEMICSKGCLEGACNK